MRLILVLWVLLLLGGGVYGRAAEATMRIHVADRHFAVTVTPVDAESRDAASAVLYMRQRADVPWVNVGTGQKRTSSSGEVAYTAEVKVDDDGVYFFTSRPVVGGKVVSQPAIDAAPQVTVVVDTLPPLAELTQPEDEMTVEPEDDVTLSWRTSDENLAERPVGLFYSFDGGKTWPRLAADLPPRGEFPWRAPAGMYGPFALRLEVADKAGNIGYAVRRLEVPFPPPPPGPELEPEPPQLADLAPLPTPGPVPPLSEPIVPAEILTAPEPPPEKIRDSRGSWLYYLMAVNLMRQNKPRDALQYYWLSVREDPDFINAWADIGLAYLDLGAYNSAREVVEQARDKAPDRIDLMHLLGETYHAEGMALLASAKSADDRRKAKGLIDEAIEWYGIALTRAADAWTLAERAPSYYRLGEICYFVNLDRDGARAYWKKILDLHAPAPNQDLVRWSTAKNRELVNERQQRQTYQWVALETWQNWARGYINQLDARERAGIVDLMPPQPVGAPGRAMAGAGGAAGGQAGAGGPGGGSGAAAAECDDGRSLFSLRAQDMAPPKPPPPPPAQPRSSSMRYESPTAQNYSFYGSPSANAGAKRGTGEWCDTSPTTYCEPIQSMNGGMSGRGGASMFSGGAPKRPPPANPDPYAFPRRNSAPVPEWMGCEPYGNRPMSGW